MKKPATTVLMLLCIFAGSERAFGQDMSSDFYDLPLEDKLEWYFDTYRSYGGSSHNSIAGTASYIVYDHGTAAIPYLKEYMKGAGLFSLTKNFGVGIHRVEPEGPVDITLWLIAYVWRHLHTYAHPVYNRHTLDETEIQWFVDEYKRRIDDYIHATRTIDRRVLASEYMIMMVVSPLGTNYILEEELQKYGHPNLLIGVREDVAVFLLKEYYEQRLSISGLAIDYEIVEE